MSPGNYIRKDLYNNQLFNGFILAAGLGTRMEELTLNTPKPMLPLAGFPLLDHALFCLHKWEIESIVINVHYLADRIEQYIHSKNLSHIFISREEPDILLSAGGIRTGLTYFPVEHPIVSINPDMIYIPASNDSPSAGPLPETDWDAILYIKKKDPGMNFTGFNISAFNRDNEIPNNAFRLEMPDGGGGDYFYIGYSIINPLSLRNIPQNRPEEIVPIWKKGAREGRLFGRIFSGDVIDIGTKAQYYKYYQTNPYSGRDLELWDLYLKSRLTS